MQVQTVVLLLFSLARQDTGKTQFNVAIMYLQIAKSLLAVYPLLNINITSVVYIIKIYKKRESNLFQYTTV